jgi:hypothetical protein
LRKQRKQNTDSSNDEATNVDESEAEADPKTIAETDSEN